MLKRFSRLYVRDQGQDQTMAEACISTVWRRGSLDLYVFSVDCCVVGGQYQYTIDLLERDLSPK